MCQDENENIGGKPKLWFVLELRRDEQTDPSMSLSTEAWFVRHRLYPEGTKTFVFGFVFVLAHEQLMTLWLYKQIARGIWRVVRQSSSVWPGKVKAFNSPGCD